MQQLVLSIGARTFSLLLGFDRIKLEKELVTAARDGGGMVEIPTAGRQSIRALVTPGLAVTLETTESADNLRSVPALDDQHSFADEFDGNF
jgi:hypothetical protein